MFRDTEEELNRLEQELLQEEEREETEDFSEFLPQDPEPAEGPMVYQNFSNDYGRGLRNYATAYKAYNSDTVDEDLERFSEEVRQPGRNRAGWIIVTVLALITALLAIAVWLYLGMGGLG